ncbi:MAG: MMPL family transporter, partial [Candidatus Dadabacteria bacterium]|nr:MMPL family transporter [Candidatus Dadabacteria bacterium]NIQ14856.1 MMPL family transporter [Candidatus Dadabacteria bacterium]
VDFIIKWRWFVLIGTIVLAFVLVQGAKNLGLSTDYRVFFSKDNPDLVAFDSLENIYTKNDNVLFIVSPNDGEIFEEKTLNAILEITKESWQLPYSTRVDSITNFQHTWANGDELVVEDLLTEKNISAETIKRVKEVSLSEPFIYRKLISKDGNATGINVRIQLPGKSTQEIPEVSAAATEMKDTFKSKYPELDIKLVGIAMMNNAFAETPIKDMQFVMPLMFFVFIFGLLFFLRSIFSSGITLFIVILSAFSTLGIAGYFGTFLDPVSSSVPNIILTLAVADSIHILITFFESLRAGKSRLESIFESFEVNAKPVFLTSLTTAIGFLSLNFSDSPPFRLLGNLTAIGVFAAWFYSMTFLPAALAILPIRAPKKSHISTKAVDFVTNLVINHNKKILAGLGAITIFLLVSIFSLNINDRYHEYFSKKLDIRNAMEYSIKKLNGVYVSSFSLESGESSGVSHPEFLQKVDEFTSWLRNRPEVEHVNSFSDTMKRLNKNMNADDPNYYKIPETRDLGAQYLLLYELSLPYGLDINDQLNIDKSSIRLDVTYSNPDLKVIEKSGMESNRWLNENGTESMKNNRAAGTTLMFANITRRNIESMIIGTIVGFGLIAIILMIALMSFKIGLISLIPNILPTAMAFGIWALIKGEVGFAVSVVASISIGIIVDDTVHFLSKYHRAKYKMGYETRDAIRYAFETVGTAIIGTSFIIALGFAMLGFSTFRVTAYMGLITSLAIICALITDFFLLPSLLIAIDNNKKQRRSQ